MNGEKLRSSDRATFKNSKSWILHKIRLFKWIKYSINSNLRTYQRIRKNMFSTGNFEHTENYVHTTESLALWKTLNIYIHYLIFYPRRQHVKWKHVKHKLTFNNDFMMNWELNLSFIFSVWLEITLACNYLVVGDFICRSKLMSSSCRKEFYLNEFW